MRCKNCGLENDENLYICQNCGSPLYDEADFENDEQATKKIDTQAISNAAPKAKQAPPAPQTDDEKKKNQLTIIIIALCVVLVAIIVGIIAVVANGNDQDETSTSSITQSTTVQTTEQTTTTTTTETTTTTTTEPSSTKEAVFDILISSNKGGIVDGAGTYQLGEHVIVTATPDEGYYFDGWYSGETLLSGNASYTFTVTKNIQLKAIFAVIDEGTTSSDVDVVGGDYD